MLELSNLHGDIMAIVNPSADTAPASTYAYTEFGQAEAGSALPSGYGYMGAAERSDNALGSTVLMGARAYSAVNGRFDSTDPVAGGSANPYDYVNQSPLTNTDTTGLYAVHESCHWSIGWWNFDYYCEESVSRDVTSLIARYTNTGSFLGGSAAVAIAKYMAKIGVRASIVGWILTLLFMYAIDNISNHSSSGKCLTVKFDFGLPYWIGWLNDSNCRAT